DADCAWLYEVKSPMKAPYILFLTLSLSVHAFGQQKMVGDQQKANTATQDLSPPVSPAFTVLGITPETIARPSTPVELATALVNGVDRNGNFQTGLAIDVAPYMVAKGNTLQLYDYRNDRFKRFWARAQVSFATTKGTSDTDKAVRAALGGRFSI